MIDFHENVEQSNSTSLRDATRTLLVENSVPAVETKTVHEGESSAAPVAQNEFFSSDEYIL
ncbi:hypothetical protein [Nostoc sp. ATCC 53789]|uniref:hypothetical protein n=1 Tax=Nostoc sp. ATCC 53789 TaxID=76335 RepID=UPI000DEC646E|nr:hypothetical protein [Nostoc sp. ATCC 53789]MBD2512294.1 hypothetical protein [Desmonostoc muscorum FACHB-395]QHG20477.1 hypothetical protein GJB62_31605 [Nostoc sp. ATCC 53789]RCJ15789.1 hypothetical protein A6V25_32150 [Nostoc sp. ATCC 53789]